MATKGGVVMTKDEEETIRIMFEEWCFERDLSPEKVTAFFEDNFRNRTFPPEIQEWLEEIVLLNSPMH
jgi:hypothetical protein